MSLEALMQGQVLRPVAEVTSFLGSRYLGSVPIAQGTVEEFASGDKLGQLDITVPATNEWIPNHPEHPLAAEGQELIVRRGFRLADGETIGWRTLGRFRIMKHDPSDDWLKVEADSVDVRLELAKWIVNTRTEGNWQRQAQAVAAGLTPLRFEADDGKAWPRTWEQQKTRRESLLELCDAWGTSLRMIDGQLTVVPRRTSTTPTYTLRTGDGGTVVHVGTPERAEIVSNVVVASSAPEDDTPPISSMAVTEYGPRRWNGPYGQVTSFYASPFLRTYPQVRDAARARLERLQASQPTISVDAITDPRWELDGVARVVDERHDTDFVMKITGIVHALTAGQEPGRIDGLILSGKVRGQAWQ